MHDICTVRTSGADRVVITTYLQCVGQGVQHIDVLDQGRIGQPSEQLWVVVHNSQDGCRSSTGPRVPIPLPQGLLVGGDEAAD